MMSLFKFSPARQARIVATLLWALGLSMAGVGMALANEPSGHGNAPATKNPSGDIAATSASNPKEVGNQVRDALGTRIAPNQKLTVKVSARPAVGAEHGTGVAVNPQTRRALLQARKAPAVVDTHAGEAHWSYEGMNGPQAWGSLKPEFNLCSTGKRQSPINIEENNALAGPAEPIQFNYTPSNATVVNNGHTIQVDVQGENSITIRGTNYRLAQFHFHTPSEEQINGRRFSMVAHLVHKSDVGQLAVVAVLLETGTSNVLMDTVWTYMPLDVGDRVNMPREMLNMNELLPSDQRYYQFIGSLTTPPCSEGVLWLVLKQPMKISKAQQRLFTQLYPNNARPVQPVNGRPVRDAQ